MSEDILKSAPGPLQKLISGAVPAMLVPDADDYTKNPTTAFILQHHAELDKHGIEIYHVGDANTVVANTKHIKTEAIKDMVKQGTVLSAFPTLEALEKQEPPVIQRYGISWKAHVHPNADIVPRLETREQASARENPEPVIQPILQTPIHKLPGAIIRKINNARIAAFAPKPPTNQPDPGAGEIANAIQKRAT